MALRACTRTVYQLPGVAPTVEAMLEAVNQKYLNTPHAVLRVSAPQEPIQQIAVIVPNDREQVGWGDVFSSGYGESFTISSSRPAALHLLAVDGMVYALGADMGYRMLEDSYVNKRFGLAFVLRAGDPYQLRGLVSRTIGEARTDIALTPAGKPVLSFAVREHAQHVDRLGAYLKDLKLTRSHLGRVEQFGADGGAGLRIPLGVEREDLIADLREIGRVLRDEKPQPELEFVEHITPVKDAETLELLDIALDAALGEPADGRIVSAVPTELWQPYQAARMFHIRIGRSEPGHHDDFDLAYLLGRARVHRQGTRLDAVRMGTVSGYLYPKGGGQERLFTTSALRWIEAQISVGSRRFCFTDGEWYELGARFVETIRAIIARLFPPRPSVDLPTWYKGQAERQYNESVPDTHPQLLCMDRKNARNPVGTSSSQFEVCDLLTKDGTLILVKPAHGGSGPLSHLFNQSIVAIQLLLQDAEVRRQFTERVAAEAKDKGKDGFFLPADFVPRRVVFAIKLGNGATLTPETLFPFSQITLAQTARALEQAGISVEVIGIPESTEKRPARSAFTSAA
ncbi:MULTISPECIES: DUF6119 family protein [unclassified Streptomyces]|uniref:DUF6119 family protein n=1 Tax=unclassified Streptomyces TaxID=2593676 RepID=UPI002E81C420|nr:DUF6119 family protein [Streptomyces sp. NBC_00589]WTI39629.1 TIGR04141 family sporadically distributed protein [Streptomyces sp. NBC_00775]WUB26692.1 TIGR04141 family sporadically distributed protein [Streptomyces sp. NBC_00589]